MNSSPSSAAPVGRVELLAPAGEMDAAYAAFHYGADAIYTGLPQFSARAEAVNVTPEELDEITAYAHSLTPRRRVFVTVNTLVLEHELSDLIKTLGHLARLDVDAVIVQDLGVCRLARRYFPELALHASTQMAIHNVEGAITAREMGFKRVTLARELTLEEIQRISAESGLETEVFIHGALCYSYSGLCLYSSLLRNRSGNRGKCTYPCRDWFTATQPPPPHEGKPPRRDASQGMAFSMKDLALPEDIAGLRTAGVASMKIEGRKKSPLYVATVVNFYRRILDGKLSAEDKKELQADLQTVFSRPLTRWHVRGRRQDVVEPSTAGHQGTIVGAVESIAQVRQAKVLRFVTRRAIERHDGLQIELPGLERPFGFPVDTLRLLKDRNAQTVFEAAEGSHIEVELPPDAPFIPQGVPIYCASSQRVKRKYRHERPRPGQHRLRVPFQLDMQIETNKLSVQASISLPASKTPLQIRLVKEGPFQPAKDPAATHKAVQTAFEKMGNTCFVLDQLKVQNPQHLFVPVSLLNALRREAAEQLDQLLQAAHAQRVQGILLELERPSARAPASPAPLKWAIKVDRFDSLDDFPVEAMAALDEVVLNIGQAGAPAIQQTLELWTRHIPHDRIRLALPLITRAWEEKALRQTIAALREAGWTKWEIANPSGWAFLGVDPSTGEPQHYPLEICTDASVYVMNRQAAQQALDMGAERLTLSPEDGFSNMKRIIEAFPEESCVILYQDVPLFISESCALANLAGACTGKGACSTSPMEMSNPKGERIEILQDQCRTLVLNAQPYCIAGHLDDIRKSGAHWVRADFIHRPYPPAAVWRIWNQLQEGRRPPRTIEGQFNTRLA